MASIFDGAQEIFDVAKQASESKWRDRFRAGETNECDTSQSRSRGSVQPTCRIVRGEKQTPLDALQTLHIPVPPPGTRQKIKTLSFISAVFCSPGADRFSFIDPPKNQTTIDAIEDLPAFSIAS